MLRDTVETLVGLNYSFCHFAFVEVSLKLIRTLHYSEFGNFETVWSCEVDQITKE